VAYYNGIAGAALTLACVSTPSIENTDERLYLASAETTRSENDVTGCARSRTETSALRNGTIENTAYGRGPVSDRLSFRTHRAGDRIVLTVSARSYVFPESGRGEGNSNVVQIPVSAQAKDQANQIIKICTAESR
jgi:hypothetical protein